MRRSLAPASWFDPAAKARKAELAKARELLVVLRNLSRGEARQAPCGPLSRHHRPLQSGPGRIFDFGEWKGPRLEARKSGKGSDTAVNSFE